MHPDGKNSVKLPAALVAAESDAQLALLIGDLAYALGYGADWDVFGQQFEEAFTMWPLLTGGLGLSVRACCSNPCKVGVERFGHPNRLGLVPALLGMKA